MFGRLSPSWQREWRMDRFTKFIEEHRLVSFDLDGGVFSGTDIDYEWKAPVRARLVFADKTSQQWHFITARKKQEKDFFLSEGHPARRRLPLVDLR